MKIGIVLGGYVAAVLAGILAGWAYDASLSRVPYDTSGGMYAGGQLLASTAAFLVVSLVPTVAGLWFVRHHVGFWNGVAIASIRFAASGLVAVLTSMAWRGAPQSVSLVVVDLLGLSQLLGVPFWFGGFVLFAVIAPTREIRAKLTVAIMIELVIAVCALVHWLRPGPPI